MVKNDRMRMIRVTRTPVVSSARPVMALLLFAAGFSAFAQAPEAASAPEATLARPLTGSVAAARPAASILQPVSALAAAPTWQSLTPVQRELLSPLQRDWDKLSANQRIKWLNATPRLAALSVPELARIHERMNDWAHLTPAERTDARIGFQVAKQVDAEERQAKWAAYQALPPEKRQALADKAAARREAKAASHGGPQALAGTAKSNIVPPAPKLVTPTAVAGSLIQAKPGATTVLITRGLDLPSHHAAGEAKVVADPALVDAKTLLPKSLKAPSASDPRP